MRVGAIQCKSVRNGAPFSQCASCRRRGRAICIELLRCALSRFASLCDLSREGGRGVLTLLVAQFRDHPEWLLAARDALHIVKAVAESRALIVPRWSRV